MWMRAIFISIQRGDMCENGLSTTESQSSERRPSRWRKIFPSCLRDEKGSSVIEFAFVAMFLFTLVAGAVDFGGAYQNYIVLVNASREGARLYSRLPCKADNRYALESAVKSATVNEADLQ